MVRRRRARSEAEGEEAGALWAADEQKQELGIRSLGRGERLDLQTRGATTGGAATGRLIASVDCGLSVASLPRWSEKRLNSVNVTSIFLRSN